MDKKRSAATALAGGTAGVPALRQAFCKPTYIPCKSYSNESMFHHDEAHYTGTEMGLIEDGMLYNASDHIGDW